MLRRERNRPRSRERLREPSEHRQVGVKLDALKRNPRIARRALFGLARHVYPWTAEWDERETNPQRAIAVLGIAVYDAWEIGSSGGWSFKLVPQRAKLLADRSDSGHQRLAHIGIKLAPHRLREVIGELPGLFGAVADTRECLKRESFVYHPLDCSGLRREANRDLTILARLAQALSRARAVPLAA